MKPIWTSGRRYGGNVTALASLCVFKNSLAEEKAPNEQNRVHSSSSWWTLRPSRNNVCSCEGLSPLSPVRIFRPNPNLEIGFDVRTRCPVYVLEKLVVVPPPVSKIVEDTDEKDVSSSALTRHKTSRHRRRSMNYREEKSLPECFRSRNSAYHFSGYDRGHMAPAADFKHDDEQLEHTYNLINVSPQDHKVNRQAWARLEDWARRVADKYDRENREAATSTYVVTGPLWLPHRQIGEKQFEYRYPALGNPPSLVSVPTHFYKVVVVVRDDSEITHHACFVVPNSPDAKDWKLEQGLVRWSDLEAVVRTTKHAKHETEMRTS